VNLLSRCDGVDETVAQLRAVAGLFCSSMSFSKVSNGISIASGRTISCRYRDITPSEPPIMRDDTGVLAACKARTSWTMAASVDRNSEMFHINLVMFYHGSIHIIIIQPQARHIGSLSSTLCSSEVNNMMPFTSRSIRSLQSRRDRPMEHVEIHLVTVFQQSTFNIV